MGRYKDRDKRLSQLYKRIEKNPYRVNQHHLVARSRGGTNEPANLLTINSWKHECWHELFKNRTINEIIIFLKSRSILLEKYPEEWEIVFRKHNTDYAIKILKKAWVRAENTFYVHL